jgi:hypothetical protein
MIRCDFRLTLIFLVALSGSQALADPPSKVDCVPNGTANEQTGCAHNRNVDLWNQLVEHYNHRLKALQQKCLKDFSGGGSGGFADRVDCLSTGLRAEAKRAKLRQ